MIRQPSVDINPPEIPIMIARNGILRISADEPIATPPANVAFNITPTSILFYLEYLLTLPLSLFLLINLENTQLETAELVIASIVLMIALC